MEDQLEVQECKTQTFSREAARIKSRDFAERLRGPPGQPSSRHAGGVVADKQLTRKTRNLGYENGAKNIKNDF